MFLPIKYLPECFAPTVLTIKLSAVRAALHHRIRVNVFTDKISAVRAKHSGTKVNVFTDKISAGMLRPDKVNVFTDKISAGMLRPDKVNVFTDKISAGMLRPDIGLAAICFTASHSPP
jgi:hypothetical protein